MSTVFEWEPIESTEQVKKIKFIIPHILLDCGGIDSSKLQLVSGLAVVLDSDYFLLTACLTKAQCRKDR